jgi:serine/threonine-protein kinase
VYRTRSTKASQLFVRELSKFELRPLPGTQAATTPFFSPDGRWVGFWRAEDRILRKVSVAGGSPIELGPTDVPIRALWGPNDEIVFQTGSKGQLWSIPAGGGKPQEIVVRDRSDRELISLRAWGPERNDLLVASIDPEGTWLDLLSRDTGRRRRVLKGRNFLARYTRSGHLVYSDADALVAVPLDRRFQPVGAPTPVMYGIDSYFGHSNAALSDNGTLVYWPAERVRDAELRWLDGHGTFTPVPGGCAPFVSIALSPDGREVAGNLVEGQKQQVWIFDLARGARRLLISEEDSSRVIWSRDGKFITYFGRRNGAQGLYRTRAGGTGAEEFLVRPEGQYPWPEDWSPDGQSLLFSQYTDRGDSDVWIYARGKATPLMTSPFNEAGATFSPDGRFIAFEADDGGVSHVYVQPFPGPGARQAVSVDESGSPRWAADGQRLFFFEQPADHGRDRANQSGHANWPAGASGRPATGVER